MSLQRALARLAEQHLPVLAGGTDFYPALRDAPPPANALDITALDELRGISLDEQGVRIGAATSWQSIVKGLPAPAFDALRAAAREIGSVQIQSRGTLGGNLCTASPAADGVPPLLALDASVILASVRGERELPLERFLLGPRRTALADDELLIAIRIPTPAPGTVSRFFKLGARRYLVISIAMLAISLRADEQGRACNVRLAVGACSPVAVRLARLEAALDGLTLDNPAALDSAISEALDDDALAPLQPIDDVRASAAYRRDAVATAVRRLIHTGAASALAVREPTP